MRLDTKLYDSLLAKVELLLKSGRPGDYEHTASLYRKLVEDYEGGLVEYDPRIMLSATVLHDVGFGFIKEEYMKFFTGHTRVEAMRQAANELTLGYVPVILGEFEFSDAEIKTICEVIEYAEDTPLGNQDISREATLLHDMNLFDRFLPHRLNYLKQAYPDAEKARVLLDKSLSGIKTDYLKKQAEAALIQYLKES